MERGLKSPTAETLIRLARRYKTSADYLLGVVDDPAPAVRRELPAFGVELLEVVRQLPEGRREELLRIGEVLLRLSQEQAAHMQAYDRMMALVEQAGGVEAVEALETALRADAAGDPARAWQLIDAFFAGRNAKEEREEARHDA
jgi:transcriptional regulator with XRE-family HTH domain